MQVVKDLRGVAWELKRCSDIMLRDFLDLVVRQQ